MENCFAEKNGFISYYQGQWSDAEMSAYFKPIVQADYLSFHILTH